MKRILFFSAVTLLALVMTASAADIAGKWKAKSGDSEITINFKVDGESLTGTVDIPVAGKTPIKDGKVAGDSVSFNVVRSINDSEIVITWKGKVVGDEIRFLREMQGGGGAGPELIAKKAK